ncbi:NAD(P)-dependent oxidoreductase [Lichenifustis flavocetrariae]|uniref:NAD(P)-dependent oxidoreductase n=1 Tax=Lichenifustis flavocetrariae TaxID=2949735 RepID=A0AA41YSR4_9HYPH|nr:NAD(P)-dependent oxidoreductase [Lichenifustis flavocetrariae]MCW6507896.1 NAD(P)-dependent oxidoreductase [Lichenifustis flavocetrariae]
MRLSQTAQHGRPPSARNRVLVVASPTHSLELLRWATILSDDILFVAESIDAASQRFATHFAIETRRRTFRHSDLSHAGTLLLSLPDPEKENQIVRAARRQGVAAHVVDRPLVSDFTVLALLQQPLGSSLAA